MVCISIGVFDGSIPTAVPLITPLYTIRTLDSSKSQIRLCHTNNALPITYYSMHRFPTDFVSVSVLICIYNIIARLSQASGLRLACRHKDTSCSKNVCMVRSSICLFMLRILETGNGSHISEVTKYWLNYTSPSNSALWRFETPLRWLSQWPSWLTHAECSKHGNGFDTAVLRSSAKSLTCSGLNGHPH